MKPSQPEKKIDRISYPTDLTDAEWAILEPWIPPVTRSAYYEVTPRREIVNALVYLDRTGVQWRNLPHDFPNWQLVYHYFQKWTKMGIWKRALDTLRRQVRVQQSRTEEPTVAILDSPSVKTTEMGGERGFDAGKKVKGRKRHVVVDGLGLVLALWISSASVQDRDAGPKLVEPIHRDVPTVRKVWVDSGYRGEWRKEAKKNGISTWKWWSEFQAQRDLNFCLSGGLWSGPGHGGTGNEG